MIEGWLINVIGALALFALGVVLMLADVKLGTGLVSLMGTACTFMAVVILAPLQAPPEKQEFVLMIRNVIMACGIVAAGFFAFVSYKAYEAKKLKKKVDISTLVGERGVAKTDINPRGVVNVGGELWSAIIEGEDYIAKGEEVEVAGYDGITLIVRPSRRGEGEKATFKWRPA
ncbi:MAG: NfeD family protein [Candidatus Jordarchaeales archaeon]|nr:hypothetical protein [Candidatus Jordarchaeia archaeon]